MCIVIKQWNNILSSCCRSLVTGPVSTVVAKSCVSSSVTGSLAMSRARSCCHANIRALVSVVKRVPLCAGSAIRTRSLKCSLEMKTSQTQGIITAHVKKLYCAFFAGSICTTFHRIGLIVSVCVFLSQLENHWWMWMQYDIYIMSLEAAPTSYFLWSFIATWQMHDVVRWLWHWCHLIHGSEMCVVMDIVFTPSVWTVLSV
jgi:hypothetical protein